MSRLIQALQIFLKYGDLSYPTHCEHDAMYVMVNPAIVSVDDMLALETLGFMPTSDDTFVSYRFGSA